MKADQLPFFAACPILYWPWLWLQFRRLDRWIAESVAYGDRGTILLHLGPRGRLVVSHVSDNLRDDAPATYTTLTFESLTWAYYPEWMYSVVRTQIRDRSLGDGSGVQSFARPAEITDALIPIP